MGKHAGWFGFRVFSLTSTVTRSSLSSPGPTLSFSPKCPVEQFVLTAQWGQNLSSLGAITNASESGPRVLTFGSNSTVPEDFFKEAKGLLYLSELVAHVNNYSTFDYLEFRTESEARANELIKLNCTDGPLQYQISCTAQNKTRLQVCNGTAAIGQEVRTSAGCTSARLFASNLRVTGCDGVVAQATTTTESMPIPWPTGAGGRWQWNETSMITATSVCVTNAVPVSTAAPAATGSTCAETAMPTDLMTVPSNYYPPPPQTVLALTMSELSAPAVNAAADNDDPASGTTPVCEPLELVRRDEQYNPESVTMISPVYATGAPGVVSEENKQGKDKSVWPADSVAGNSDEVLLDTPVAAALSTLAEPHDDPNLGYIFPTGRVDLPSGTTRVRRGFNRNRAAGPSDTDPNAGGPLPPDQGNLADAPLGTMDLPEKAIQPTSLHERTANSSASAKPEEHHSGTAMNNVKLRLVLALPFVAAVAGCLV